MRFKIAIFVLPIVGLLLWADVEAVAQADSKMNKVPLVCRMIGQPIPPGISQRDFTLYEDRLVRECELAETYRRQEAYAQSQFGISLTDISAYQALRFIGRQTYDKSRSDSLPFEKSYQICYADYNRPVAERSSIIWRNWVQGVRHFNRDTELVKSGSFFSLTGLLQLHKGFYQLSDEYCAPSASDINSDINSNDKPGFNNEPHPGLLKASGAGEDGYWWKLDPNEVESVRSKVDGINAFYRNLGILGRASIEVRTSRISEEVLLDTSDVLSVRPVKDGFAIWSGASNANKDHLGHLLKFATKLNEQARRGEAMTWQNQNGQTVLFTPGELAFAVQQYFVRIHPFAEGNGRVSRYLQEVILQSFGLPHGASGDLTRDDVLSEHMVYYNLAIERTEQILFDTDRCLIDVYQPIMDNNPGLTARSFRKKMLSESLPYECQLVK